MSTAAYNQNDVKDLELEAHYLFQALSKLKPRTPEWTFLHQKLEAAEEELAVIRTLVNDSDGNNINSTTVNGDYRDDPTSANFAAVTPPSADRTETVWTSQDGFREDPDDTNASGGDYHDDKEGNDRRPLVYDDAGSRSSFTSGVHPRRKFSRILAPGGDHPTTVSDDNDNDDYDDVDDSMRHGAITREEYKSIHPKQPPTGGKKYLILSALSFLVTLGFIVAIALNLNKGDDNKTKNINNGEVKTTFDPDNNYNHQPKYQGPCASFSLHLIPDKFGNETSWEIIHYKKTNPTTTTTQQQLSSEVVVLQGGPYSYKKEFDSHGDTSTTPSAIGAGSHYEMVHATTCLPVGSYAFNLYDARGDGICCTYGRGEYGINLSRDRTIRPLSPGNFVGVKEVTEFEVKEDDVDVLPPDTSVSMQGKEEVDIEDVPEGPCASFSMHLIPDQFGNETSWKVRRYDGVEMSTIIELHQFQKGTIVLQGGPYFYKKEFERDAAGSHYEMIHATTCLEVGSYTFILYDAKGDGICCNYGRGEYGINLSKGRVIRPLSSGKFSGAGEVTPFEVTTADIDVLPALSSVTAITDHATGVAVEDSTGDDGMAVGTPDDSSLLPNTGSDGEPCASFSMHLVPDQFGNETSWEVLQKVEGIPLEDGGRRELGPATPSPETRFLRAISSISNSRRAQEQQWTVALAGGPYSYREGFDSDASTGGTHYNAIVAKTCLPVGTYKFIMYDAGGDGICCVYGQGEYGINLSKGRVIRPLSSGEFMGVDEVTPFEVTAADIDIRPVSRPSTVAVGNDPNDPPDWSSSSHSGHTSALDTIVNHVNPLETFNLPQTWSSSVTNGPPATSINSLMSLATLSGDGSTNGHGKSYGILFDVEASPSASPLVIAGMGLNLDTKSETHYEIWTKAGSWQDVNSANPDYKNGFRQVSHGRITGKGSADFTEIALNDFQDVDLPAGHRQAFYVTLSDNNLVFQNYEEEGISRHNMVNEVQLGKDEVKVYYGAAVRAYPLDVADPVTDFWNNAGFLGRLWYKKHDR